jgi:hypothetical protein
MEKWSPKPPSPAANDFVKYEVLHSANEAVFLEAKRYHRMQNVYV